jgi:hypothetical protein
MALWGRTRFDQVISGSVDKSTIYQICIFACAVGVAGFTLLGFRAAKDEQSKQDADRESKLDTHLHRLEGLRGDPDAREKYIAALRKSAQLSEQAAVGSDFAKFKASKDQRQELKKALDESNDKAINEARMRIEPMRDLIFSRLDGWAEEMKKEGAKVEVIRRDAPVAALVGENTISFPYELVFETGARMRMIINPYQIANGQHAFGPFSMGAQYEPKGGNEGYQFTVNVGSDYYELLKSPAGPYTFEPYRKESKDDPANDPEFVKRARLAINEVMTYALSKNSNL